MKKFSHIARLFVAGLAGLSLLSLVACSGDSGSSHSTTFQNATSILIDVRSPDEFAAGHVEGAINLDFESGALESELSSLDQNAEYMLYCRSGRRSALATALMVEAGFTDVTDLGGIDAAAKSTDLPIVTD